MAAKERICRHRKKENAARAIRDVFENTFTNNAVTEVSSTDATSSAPINIYAGTGENAELSNMYNRPFSFWW